MTKQIMFYEPGNGENRHGGILLENGDVVCGCCGGVFEASERNVTWVLESEYDFWVNLDEVICGDELTDATEPEQGEGVPADTTEHGQEQEVAEEADKPVEGFDEVYN